MDPSARRVGRRVIDATPQELPRINKCRSGRSYAYVYTVSVPPRRRPTARRATRLYKHDIENGSRRAHEFGAGRLPGEFVFVPEAADADEDEGWVVGFVIDRATETTEFAILEARSFEAALVATVRLPRRTPLGFHGNGVPAA